MAEKDLKDSVVMFETFLEEFKKDYLDKIAHVAGHPSQEFDSLYVFGNFYRLAIENDPQLKERWENYDKKHQARHQKISEAVSEAQAKAEEILNAHDMSLSVGSRGRDSYYDRVCLLKVGNSSFTSDNHGTNHIKGVGAIAMTDHLISEFERLSQTKDCKLYLSLVEKLNRQKGLFAKARNSAIQQKIENLTGRSHEVQKFIQLVPVIDTIKQASEELKGHKDYFKEIERTWAEKDPYTAEREALKDDLYDKSKTIFDHAYLDLVEKSTEVLKLSREEVNQEIYATLSKGTEYYTRSHLTKASQAVEDLQKVEEFAETLYELWKKENAAEGSFSELSDKEKLAWFEKAQTSPALKDEDVNEMN